MKAVLAFGYPYPIGARSIHSINLPAIKELLRSSAWCDLSVVTQLCPSKGAQMCSYHWWLCCPDNVLRRAWLRVLLKRMRVFFAFVGVYTVSHRCCPASPTIVFMVISATQVWLAISTTLSLRIRTSIWCVIVSITRSLQLFGPGRPVC